MLRQCSTPLVRSALLGPQWQQLAAAASTTASSWPCSASSCLQDSTAAAAGTGRSYSAAGMPANAMDLIKELRKTSGAPIADVKSCLAAAGWDMGAAMEALRLKGLAAALKKASRHASEGLVAVAQLGHGLVSVVEINSETDFVGRSAPFQQLAAAAAKAALGLAPQAAAAAGQVHEIDFQQLAAARLGDGSSIEEGCALLAGQVRENIALRRGYLVSAGPHGVVSSYVHMPVAPGAGRIAAVVALQAGAQLEQAVQAQLQQLGSNLAMHSAGMASQFISRQAMPAAALAAARTDFESATAAQMPGKPAEVLAKIVDGKVAKWCKDVCLLDQTYLLDDSLTVSQLLKQQAQQLQLQVGLTVSALLRVQVGEGLQREDGGKLDFAAEVAAMAGSK